MSENREAVVAGHYGLRELKATIINAISASGLSLHGLKPTDLAAVDEFHMGGRGATVEIVELMKLSAESRVLDIGCGIGGLTRYLASEIGCRVSGLDLTPEYVDIARELTQLTGLSEKIEYQVGSALDLPFQNAVFDAVTTFHVAMKIADRRSMYHEAARVLRPGGVFTVYDVMKGSTPGMLFPVPWAETEATNHLISPTEMNEHLQEANFLIEYEEDRTPLVLQHHRAKIAETSDGEAPAALGLHLLQGDNAKEKSQNMIRMVEANQIALGVFIARRNG